MKKETPIGWKIVGGLYRSIRPVLSSLEAGIIGAITHQIPITQRADQDVYIVGYPRSGTTWFRNLMMGVIYGIDLDFSTPKMMEDLVPEIENKRYYTRYDTPMYFNTRSLPRPEFRRVVYLLRDGRDVMVSHWHILLTRSGKQIDFMGLVDGRLLKQKWSDHVDAWLANPYNSVMIVIKYEDLLINPVRELRRFCNFFGIEREDSLLIQAAEKATFAKMRLKETRYKWQPEFGAPGSPYFIRRGEIGSYKDEMPPDVLAAYLESSGSTLRKCGYLNDHE